MAWLRLNAEYALCWALTLICSYLSVGCIVTDQIEAAGGFGIGAALGFLGIYHFDQVVLTRLERLHDELERQRNLTNRTGN